jgi:hypothetical protein
MGFCAGYGIAGFMNNVFGHGFMGRGCGAGFRRGAGRGMGRGFRFGGAFAQPAAAADEKEALKNQAVNLENELKAVKGRMEEIEKSQSR